MKFRATLVVATAAIALATAGTAQATTNTITVHKMLHSKTVMVGHTSFCTDVTYAKWGVDLFQIVQYKLWNHSHWCYQRGGKVTLRTGYHDEYVADLWHVAKATWGKDWYNPYTQWSSHAKGTFDLIIGGQQTQERNLTVCVVMGNQGGSRWC